MLAENGWGVYLDWKDTALPAEPDQATASAIRNKIDRLEWFIFLATPNSVASRWCPWEIGYADRAKSPDKIILIRTADSGNWYGNEYLGLYREITYAKGDLLAIFPPNQNGNGIVLQNLK